MRAQEINSEFKRTELGLIPADWLVATLGDAVEFLDGQRRPVKNSDRAKMKGEYPYYGASGIVDYVNDWIFDENLILLGEDGENILSRNLPLAFMVSGKIWVNNHAHVLRPKTGIEIRYLTEFLERIDYTNHNSGTAQPKLNKRTCLRLPVVLPPLREQEAIAEALGDADALIYTLECLLAKKRDLKQGAMQDLLTGTRRLRDFQGDWITKKLGDIAKIKTGSRNNEDKIQDGEYPFFVRSASVERINEYSYNCEAILVPGEGGIGSIFHYIFGRFDVHQRVYAITHFIDHVIGKYIYYYMVGHFGSYAMENSVKATVDSLRLPTFQNFDVALPPTVDEQMAIVAMLSDIDAEIAALERKLQKARDLKQGMMQELLTGRTRLI